jgi:DNA-binding response OmpR family regulator
MAGIKILLIQGEQQIAMGLYNALTSQHYTVDLTYTGGSGKVLFDANNYDLILIDTQLPDIPGIEVCRHVREKNDRIPLFMLSFSPSVDPLESFEAGADDHIVLSADFRELLMRIRVLARRFFGNKP